MREAEHGYIDRKRLPRSTFSVLVSHSLQEEILFVTVQNEIGNTQPGNNLREEDGEPILHATD